MFKSIGKCVVLSLLVSLYGCAQTAEKEEPVVTNHAPENTSPPRITSISDLGALDITAGDAVPWHFQDGRFSPAEWLLIEGKNLKTSTVTIDDQAVPVAGYWAGQPLVKVPNGLPPLKEHVLTIATELGSANTTFHTSHYILATDTDGKAVHLVRTNPASKGGVEEDWLQLEGDMVRPMFAQFSRNGDYLFTVDITTGADSYYQGVKAYTLKIVTYHTANPDTPKAVSQFEVNIGSSPMDMRISDNNQLLILGKRSFLLVDASNPHQLQKIVNKRLPWNEERTTYVDAEFFDSSRHIAFLETHQNTVVVIENSSEADYREVQSLELLPNKDIPLSVDLEVDPRNDANIWVLESANYRLTDNAVGNIYKRLRYGSIEEEDRPVAKLQLLEWEKGELLATRTIDLPRNYAGYFGKFDQQGRLLVTMTKLDFLNLQSEHEEGVSIVKKVGRFLWDSIAIGRVIAINLDTGEYETAASGVGIYYDIVDVPEIGPVFSLLKFGPSFSFPYLSPNWGLGISSTGTYTKRKMDKKTVFPPYSVGFVDYQR